MLNISSVSYNTNEPLIDSLKQLRASKDAEFVSAAGEFLGQARQHCDLKLMAKIYFEECLYHNNVTSEYKLSMVEACKCLGIATKMNFDSTLRADAFRMIGVNYNFMGEFTKAHHAFDEGIRILECIAEKSEDEMRALAGLYLNMVTLHRELVLDENKIKYLDTAFDLYSKLGDRQGLARTYLSFASFHPDVKGTCKVTEYFEKAAALFRQIDDYRGLGNSLINLGHYYCCEKDFDKGMPVLLDGIEQVKKSGSIVYVINGMFNLGVAYRGLKDYKRAIETFAEVEKLIGQSKTGLTLASLYFEWSATLEECGDQIGAFNLFKKFYEQKEHLHSFDKDAAISHAKMLSELENQRREANALRRKNTEIETYVRRVEASNFELRQFAHVTSHDLKEPLHTVSSYMQLLEKRIVTRINDEEKEFLNYAKDGAKKMYSLINSLLALSKINTQTALEPVDLNHVLKDVIGMIHLEMERRKFKVISPALPVVMANKAHMHQVFQNLIANAMKYNQSAAPFVEITYLRSDTTHYFSFIDNGIGIDQKFHDKVFEIFQRLHTHEEYTGSGVGLTVCKKIIEQMGGKISIQTNQYRGSDFNITIPV